MSKNKSSQINDDKTSNPDSIPKTKLLAQSKCLQAKILCLEVQNNDLCLLKDCPLATCMPASVFKKEQTGAFQKHTTAFLEITDRKIQVLTRAINELYALD